MQSKTADEMSDFVVDNLINYFDNKVSDFSIFNIDEEEAHKSFCVQFKAYSYFIILLSYEKGRFGCSIQVGEHAFISLENSQKWWDEADFDVFLKELQEQIELRIPDKFLKAYGWM